MALSDEEIRNQARRHWTAAAEGWIARRKEVSQPTRPITEHILRFSRPTTGHRVLDLACGAGDPAFTLAQVVGDKGFVHGLDISQAMVDGARAFADENDVRNVHFEAIQSELNLGVQSESFDLCTCRHGLMFMPNPQRAMASLSNAAKPGGRITISTWGLPERSPAFTLLGRIISKHANQPAPAYNGPGLFALSTPEIHAKLFEGIGFEEVESHKFDCPVMLAENPQTLWERFSTAGGPMVNVLQEMEPTVQERVRNDFIETLSSMFPSGEVALTAEAIVTTGRKPVA